MATAVGGEYLALARKYRPQTFADVVGQEHVLKALSHSIDAGRMHHAYLFTGTRGIGKTTIARIFAKALECEQGVSSHPCGQCETCKAIMNGVFPDVVEIDAASQTKVDDTRQLLENTKYPPMNARYKIYIIDEVHMLSTSSFNALLKTLEEPPSYVKFILATTDPHKIPTTVLSRCLQFQLHALTLEQIMAQIQKVCAAENVNCTPEAVRVVARAARGSMRDALSLCDQAIALGQGQLEASTVYAMLGTIGDVLITDIVELLRSPAAVAFGAGAGAGAGAANATADVGQVLSLGDLLRKIRQLSPNYKSLLDELLLFLHDLALYQMLGGEADNKELFSFNTSLLQRFVGPVAAQGTQDKQGLQDKQGSLGLIDQAMPSGFKPEQLQLFYQIVLEGIREYADAPDGRAAFEMTLLRLLAFSPLRKSYLGESAN